MANKNNKPNKPNKNNTSKKVVKTTTKSNKALFICLTIFVVVAVACALIWRFRDAIYKIFQK
ncbi:hypothetical protein [Candidatus Phytoplasma solani]|uniref:Uncharacterized protein n=1 Tax=Candidatus Phytoplasma solani TaxID=69896 RepID=A0A421NXV5_9MOLU|nr:hypothetical protein [Candidatus Phytoplasma solani]RMI88871.1 hypothetical protein PSSA1_v1c2980 [Candidatus Phytoplasma solani]